MINVGIRQTKDGPFRRGEKWQKIEGRNSSYENEESKSVTEGARGFERQYWSSLTLTESIFWQASASCNNLEIISPHKGPAVWQSKRSVPDRSLRFSQLPVCVCVCVCRPNIDLRSPLALSIRHAQQGDKARERMNRWENGDAARDVKLRHTKRGLDRNERCKIIESWEKSIENREQTFYRKPKWVHATNRSASRDALLHSSTRQWSWCQLLEVQYATKQSQTRGIHTSACRYAHSTHCITAQLREAIYCHNEFYPSQLTDSQIAPIQRRRWTPLPLLPFALIA